MKATKGELTKISKYLWKQGHGGKKKLAEDIGCKQAELTRLLNGGTISDEKLTDILKIVDGKSDKKTK